jgi:folate-binding protein YgfZ
MRMNKTSTINISGSDALEFLQGQLTNDLKRLESEAEILSAWCNPKGRVIWFGTLWSTDSGFGMSAPVETAENIVQRLTMFRFRSKVEFEIVDEGVTVDPADLIRGGYPFIGAAQSEQFTPHMLNLDLLDAISFDKGCYTGQEIVARTHYKGATKRRTLRFESEAPVSAGDKVSLDGRDIGEVLNASGNDLLAVVPVSKVDGQLSVHDLGLSLVSLPYLDVTAS